ncbi:CRISPR-associated endonuclease Cas2 [Nocardia salmonicida]|uniref:CRISPR-associated endonuclease Cas2 n=1 Tax=Nocardia salmonicida TaxID=53431 RepID=UPI00378DA99C
MALTILACYDITDDGRRAKVAAQLQRWGDRIQYSVFLCTVTAEDLPGLLDAVTEILDADEDSFLVIRQCATCWDARVVVGQSQPSTPELYWAAF